MQSIAGFADKISSPEGAIQTAASLQVLGGSFASLADPMKLLNEGINDMEGLTKTYNKMLNGVAKINKQTGEITIGGYDRLRIKAASEAMGISYDEMMETARTKAKRSAIESDLNINPVLRGNEQSKDLIASLAQFNQNSKQYEINIGGTNKLVTKLDKNDLQALQPKDQSLNLKTVAENTLGLKEKVEAGFNAIKTSILERILPSLNSIGKSIYDILQSINSLIPSKSGIGASTGMAGTVIGGVGGLRGAGFLSKILSSSGNMEALGGLGKYAESLGMASKFAKGLPLIGGLLSGASEYSKTGSIAKGVGAGLGNWGGALAGAAIGQAVIPIPVLGALIGGGLGAFGGEKLGSYLGGMVSGNDVLLPSEGKPILLNSKDDVFAAKPGGALVQAMTPSADISKTFGGVENSYSGLYKGNQNVGGTINLNIQGSITLVGGNGSSNQISASELVKNRQFMKELTRMIGNQMNRDKNASKFVGGFNNNSF